MVYEKRFFRAPDSREHQSHEAADWQETNSTKEILLNNSVCLSAVQRGSVANRFQSHLDKRNHPKEQKDSNTKHSPRITRHPQPYSHSLNKAKR